MTYIFKKYFVTIPAIFVLILLFNLFFNETEKNSSVFFYIFSKSLSNFLKNFNFISKTPEKMIKEHEIIMKKYRALEAKYSTLRYMEDMIRKIKHALPNGKAYDRPYIPAEVIYARKNTQFEQMIFVNRGKIDDVSENNIIVDRNCLVGKIINVYERFSAIIPVNHPESRVAVYFEGTNIKGIATGTGNPSILQIKYVRDEKNQLYKGQRVYSSGDGMLYPAGFLLGSIFDVLHSTTGFSSVYVEWDVDLPNLDICYILLDDLPNRSNYVNVLEAIEAMESENGLSDVGRKIITEENPELANHYQKPQQNIWLPILYAWRKRALQL